jgi:aminomethyltransferase
MRAGVPLYEPGGAAPVGTVTSGGFGPTVGAPVAMALIDANIAPDAVLEGEVRGRRLPVAVADLPFVPPRQRRH